MRAPTERDQCQAKLDTLVESFMDDDWGAYRDAIAWLRDFADQKNIVAGRVMHGGYWFTPQTIKSVRERARVQQRERFFGLQKLSDRRGRREAASGQALDFGAPSGCSGSS